MPAVIIKKKKAERDLAQIILAEFELDVTPLVLKHRQNYFDRNLLGTD